jgi:hypothetical protein
VTVSRARVAAICVHPDEQLATGFFSGMSGSGTGCSVRKLLCDVLRLGQPVTVAELAVSVTVTSDERTGQVQGKLS